MKGVSNYSLHLYLLSNYKIIIKGHVEGESIMEEYQGEVVIGGKHYKTMVYARSSQHARLLTAREYQDLHPQHTIADILRWTSVKRLRFGLVGL